jgi:AraC-like DNA-binding protein
MPWQAVRLPPAPKQDDDGDMIEEQAQELVHQEFRKVTPEEAYAEAAFDQLVPLPALTWGERTVTTCEQLYHRYVRPATGEWIPDSVFCDLPKWVFLEYLVKRCDVLAQGVNYPDSTHLKPMLASRSILGWDRLRVYAYSSGLAAMFFAILDRERLQALDATPITTTLYIPYEDAAGQACEGFHYGVDYRALPHAPWRRGTIYLVPKAAFAPDYQQIVWFSAQPVRPLAQLNIIPWEWPLLDQVRGTDMRANIQWHNNGEPGYPWLGNPNIYPTLWKRPLVQQVRAYLDKHFAENVSLAQLGDLIHVSPFSVLRMFRAEVGLSPLQYQTQLRIAQAKQWLHSGASIAQVATDTGFVDQSHLTHHFKQIVGLTPGKYLRLQESPIRLK